MPADLSPDLTHDVNDNGTWRPAFALDVHDAHNASFWFIGEGGALTPTDGLIPRGEEPGHFRDRPVGSQ